jgi:putative flippase GtrA
MARSQLDGDTRKDGRLVSAVRGLYVRFQRLIHEAAKFGVVGVVGVFITNGGYALLHNTVGLGPVTSTTIATIVATAISYVANRYWSFRHRERTTVAREGVIFFILNGVGLLIQDAVVAFNYYILSNGNNKAAEFIALNAGIALATLFRFWSYRKWVWAAPVDGGEATASGHQPRPARRPPMAAHSAAQQQAPDQNGDGHAPGLLHANGHGPNGQGGTNGHGGGGQGMHTGPASRNGWDR